MNIDIDRIAVDRAVALLKSVGAAYAIQMRNGQKVGELWPAVGGRPASAPAEQSSVRRYTRKNGGVYRQGLFNSTGYSDAVRALEIGGVWGIRIDAKDAQRFRTNLAGLATKLWGKGSYTTCFSGVAEDGTRVVEIMRNK